MISDLFSEHLFTHKYDIDDILAALCAQSPLWLETVTGNISSHKPDAPAKHTFAIEPLPTSFIEELRQSPEQTHLSDEDKTILAHILQTATVQTLPQYFTQGRTGGWLRERVKDTALEWLDSHDLIPPSMRHINRQKAAKLYATRTIKIEDLN